MSSYICPVEGCEYGQDEQKDLDSVKGHINGSIDDTHDWGELKAEVEAQTDDQEEPEKEEQETTESGENDSEDSEPEEAEDMPNEEEYQEQHGQESSNDEDDEQSESSEGGISLPSLDRRTMMLLVGVLGVLVLLYVVAQRRGDDPEPLPDSEVTEDDSGPESDDDAQEVSLIE